MRQSFNPFGSSCAAAVFLLLGALSVAAETPTPHRLAEVDLKQRVIWGSTAEAPDGTALSFGGEDQDAEDGQAHTRLRVNGEWKDLREELRAHNALQPLREKIWALRNLQKDVKTRTRFLYFEGMPDDELLRRAKAEALPGQDKLKAGLSVMVARTIPLQSGGGGGNTPVDASVVRLLENVEVQVDSDTDALAAGVTSDLIERMTLAQEGLESAAESLGAEPSPRALSSIIYEPKTKVFILFGGDHLDYLTNDTWAFDPAARKWSHRHPASAPAPRADHTLKATGDGRVVLVGGYTYASNTDYMGGQYKDLTDGEWTYDAAADTWTGPKGVAALESRTYRTGPFNPEFFLGAPQPDAAAFKAVLDSLPANTWVKTNPPHLPRMNRDWGSAVLDPDRGLILRWSGGHCAHGGTDVLHYHIATNRWELCYPVEFPLGQLYSNTSYPDGYNFNQRPWITGHTYQNYGIDPVLKKMLFTGREREVYFYDPDLGDWSGRGTKPKEMCYSGCFYTLTTTPTPAGLVAWTEAGKLFRFVASDATWHEIKPSRGSLPGSCVDNSTVVYDSRRDRLLFARKQYGDKAEYDGELSSLDLRTLEVAKLSPQGKGAAADIPYLCQLRYDSDDDLLFAGATLPPGADGVRRTPAYDCLANRWISLKISGDDPSGPKGRNVSLGLMYDVKRKLFWAVDTDCKVYVLRLDSTSADMRPL